MPDIYVIGDTHFGHKKIVEFEAKNRPFDSIEAHDQALVERWNAVVKKNDTVIHLGDVLFGAGAFSILPKLNGIKKLVMGNHDRYPAARYLEHFTKVMGSAEYGDCILTHIPVHPCQFPRYRKNIHGHTHSGIVKLPNGVPDQRYVCVSAEHTALRPVKLLDVVGQP